MSADKWWQTENTVKISWIQLKMQLYHWCWANNSRMKVCPEMACWAVLLEASVIGDASGTWCCQGLCGFGLSYFVYTLVLFLILVIVSPAITCLLHWETLPDSLLPASTQALSLPSLQGSAPCRVWDKPLADQGDRVFLLQGNLKATHLALFLAFHFSLCVTCI